MRNLSCIIAALLAGAFVFGKMTWKSNGEMHTLLETIATVLLLMGVAMSLVRYHAKKSRSFLRLGSGFLGTALVNGYHVAVASSFLAGVTPSALTALSLWSGMTSRLFLALLMWANLLGSKRKSKAFVVLRIAESQVVPARTGPLRHHVGFARRFFRIP